MILPWHYFVMDESIKNWWILPISNPKPDLQNANVHSKNELSLLKIHRHLHKLSAGNENTDKHTDILTNGLYVATITISAYLCGSTISTSFFTFHLFSLYRFHTNSLTKNFLTFPWIFPDKKQFFHDIFFTVKVNKDTYFQPKMKQQIKRNHYYVSSLAKADILFNWNV